MTFEELNELACCTCHMSWSEAGKPVGLNSRWYCQGCFDIECDRIQKQNELRKQTERLCKQIEELKGVKMPKFKVGDKIALAKVEYRTVLEVVEASEHEYYIKRPYRPFESSVLSHSVVDIDNNYELVKPQESEPEISTAVDPDGFDIDDPESPINALAQLQGKVEALEKLVERAYREGWEEAAPKVPHVSSFRVDEDWDNSYAKDDLADIKEVKG